DEASLLSNYIINYDPDLIIVWYFLNDIQVGGTISYLEPQESKLPAFMNRLAIFETLGRAVNTLSSREEFVSTYTNGYSGIEWNATSQALQLMAATANANDLEILLFVHPVLFNLSNYPFDDIHNQVLNTTIDLGFVSTDLRPAFHGYNDFELWVHESDQHPNEIAHQLAAEYTYSNISDHINCKD
ncbi:MAG: hypothetical protein AAF846_28975, partial [Chloroflexota bacterium]